MSTQPSLFDPIEGMRRKAEGVTIAAEHAETLLDRARRIATELSRKYGEITADDVQRELYTQTGELLGNAAGALFRSAEWEFTGQWKASPRTTNHGHQNRVWRLRR